MTQQLEAAFAEASKLPDEQQDALADLILHEIDSERRWGELFARPESQDLLARSRGQGDRRSSRRPHPQARPERIVNSHLTEDFRASTGSSRSRSVSRGVQAYELFECNRQHPSLRFRRVHPTRPIYSARVGIDYRVVGVRDGDDIYWFWIGSHSEYDHLLKRL